MCLVTTDFAIVDEDALHWLTYGLPIDDVPVYLVFINAGVEVWKDSLLIRQWSVHDINVVECLYEDQPTIGLGHVVVSNICASIMKHKENGKTFFVSKGWRS